MKLKYNFVVRTVGGKAIAVAVGKDAAEFNGMIKLNETGEVIFNELKKDVTLDSIAGRLASEFDITLEQAKLDADAFIDSLRSAGLIVE